MNFSNANIGSAIDNLKSPVHNWYKFTAGFSHRFVERIIEEEKLKAGASSVIFDPFAGCGTTLVSSQKAGIPAIGNEGQEFLYDVIRAKLRWKIDEGEFESYLEFIEDYVRANYSSFDVQSAAHPLLKSLYKTDALIRLYLVRNSLDFISRYKYRFFFKLALSQTLHKVSIHPIATPYIARKKNLTNTTRAWEFFERISRQMLADTSQLREQKLTSRIYLHDSRGVNSEIHNNESSICITSPPYLNNLDYGEVSKVHTHFFEYTSDWNDITRRVRRKLVTGATTHYVKSEFDLEQFKQSDFYYSNRRIADSLIKTAEEIKMAGKGRAGKKSFDILILLYFNDMYQVLKEIRRVVKKGGKAYLILGDSAPFGIYVPTTRIIGKISRNIGFDRFRVHKIRVRGTKWKSLKSRHSLELAEGAVVLQ